MIDPLLQSKVEKVVDELYSYVSATFNVEPRWLADNTPLGSIHRDNLRDLLRAALFDALSHIGPATFSVSVTQAPYRQKSWGTCRGCGTYAEYEVDPRTGSILACDWCIKLAANKLIP